MAWEHKGYGRFDPNTYCGDCDETRCWNFPFASYDADGDLMEFVITPASGNSLETRWYKKAGTDDTMATKPYHHMETSCCVTATVAGVVNNSMDNSWCKDCVDINGAYYNHNNHDIHDVYSGYWPARNASLFRLCNLSDIDDYLHPGGLDTGGQFRSPCWISSLQTYQFLDSGVPPNIVAVAKLEGGITKTLWQKNIGTYDGNYVRRGLYSFPSGTFYAFQDGGATYGEQYYADFGTFDGRDLTIEFTSDDIVTKAYDNTLASNSGICDFGNTTITINARNNDTTLLRSCRDHVAAGTSADGFSTIGYCQDYSVPAICYANYTVDEGWGTNVPRWTYNVASSKLAVTIGGVTGIDDTVADSGLLLKSCQKCTDLNDTFDLISTGGAWYIGSKSTVGIDTPVGSGQLSELCCDCVTVSTCITDIQSYFQASGINPDPSFPYYYMNYRVSFITEINSSNGTIATFEKYIDTIDAYLNVPDPEQLKLVDCDNLSFDLDLVSQVYSSGLAPYEWQRCDFSDATVNAQWGSYDDLQIPCVPPEILCESCAEKDGPKNIGISVPADWTWNPYDDPMQPWLPPGVDCGDYQPIEGDYILANCTKSVATFGSVILPNCVWIYNEEYDITPPTAGSCYTCSPIYIDLQLFIEYLNDVDDLPWVGDSWLHRREFRVWVQAAIGYSGGSDASIEGCDCIFMWEAFVPQRPGNQIRSSFGDAYNPFGIYRGPYLDCDSDLDGLELQPVELGACPFYPRGPHQYWTWGSLPLTLSTV